jgi:hypothetical protein
MSELSANSKMINGVEHVKTQEGDYVPKTKIINDAEHQYNYSTGKYEPSSGLDSMRSQIVNSATSFYNKLKGTPSQQ